MELRQESLFADETKGGIEVIYSKFIDQRRMDYKALFGGFDHLRVITFSYGLGFVETVADMFEDVEIIIGSMNTVRPDIVDVAMHQKLEMKRLSKRKQLVERVKDGSVRIYFNMRKMSHEKLYILSADDGRCRIITGSANLSKRAFTGGQYEEITCFDGDVVMFDNRLARFESLKGMSSTTPLEPAAMVDFASVAGDSEGELEVVPVMRAKGVVYLCDMPEDDDEVETFYTFNPKDMTEEEREQYAAMREHKVDYKPVTGGRVIIPDEVRRVIRAAREAKAEREVRAVAYPKFHYDTESGAATLNGEAYEVQPEGAWVDDAHRISDIMRGYDSFIGDVEVTKQQFFKVLAFMISDKRIYGEHLPISLLSRISDAFEVVMLREDVEEVVKQRRSPARRRASQKRVLKFLELYKGHVLCIRSRFDEITTSDDGLPVACSQHRVLCRQTGECVDVRAEVFRYRRAGVARLHRLPLI